MNHNPLSMGTESCAGFAKEARFSRRQFLAGMVATSGAAVATSFFGDAVQQTAFGAAATAGTGTGKVLVVLSLRGGIDGLGIVVPHGDPVYYRARPTIAVPRASLLGVDNYFGLHPQMLPIQWLWDTGQLAAVHAVGLPLPNRSHFSAMEEIEEADPTSSVRRGWINRMIGLNTRTDAAEAVQLGTSVVPTALYGPDATLAASGLEQMNLVGANTNDIWSRRRRNQLDVMWAQPHNDALRNAYVSTTRTVDTFATISRSAYLPSNGVEYPATDLGRAMKAAAELIKADVGTDVVAIDYGSWDMHAEYGTLSGGRMQSMAAGLACVIDALMRDLGPDFRERVTLVTISEFGRRIMENGNRGLDHGWGNAMLIAGAGVKGGRYYGTWPGLGTGPDDDLAVTTDYRTVLGEILTRRFPDRSLSQVFPGFNYKPLGFMR